MNVKSVWFHVVFWILYTVIFTIIQGSYKGEYEQAFVYELLNLPIRLVVVYFNYYILLPKFLLKGEMVKYFAYTILTLVVAGFFQRIANYHALDILYPDYPDHGIWLFYKFLQASVIIASPLIFVVGISVIWRVSELQKRAKSLENEKLQSELKYLKSQINPHFLFNTLNNIYGLSLDNSEKVSDLILKLSDFLSFSLYESNEKLIPLEKEISLINDFVDLEKSRFEDRVEVKFSFPANVETVSIPPLIFIPFVENAFKHSLKDETEVAQIDIDLARKEKELIFHVSNSKPSEVYEDAKKHGIGLENIKRRLDIIFGGKYQLDILDEKSRYQITLKIPTQA